LKKILRYKWSDYCSNVDIIERIRGCGINIGTIQMTITKRRLLHLGRVIRMKDCRLSKSMLYGGFTLGKIASGGQETSYHKCVKDDLIKCNMYTDFQVIEGLALDKRQWLRSVDVGIKELFNDWHAERNNESYQHHFE
jgi:hypothetical protein